MRSSSPSSGTSATANSLLRPLRAPLVDHDVARHGEQPGTDAGGGVEHHPVAPGTQQRLLHDVLGASAVVPGQAQAVGPQRGACSSCNRCISATWLSAIEPPPKAHSRDGARAPVVQCGRSLVGTGRSLAKADEEAVAERVHPPHRCVGDGCRPVCQPQPAIRSEHPRVVGDHADRDVVIGGLAGHDRGRLVVAEHDQDQVGRCRSAGRTRPATSASTRSTCRRPPAPVGEGQMTVSEGRVCGIPSKTEPSPTALRGTIRGERRPRVRGWRSRSISAITGRRSVCASSRRRNADEGVLVGHRRHSRTAGRRTRRCGSRRACRSGRTTPLAASPWCWTVRRRRCAIRPDRRRWLRVDRSARHQLVVALLAVHPETRLRAWSGRAS